MPEKFAITPDQFRGAGPGFKHFAVTAALALGAMADPARALEIIYFKAADCVHCARFEAAELPEYQSSALAKKVRIRAVDVGSYRVKASGVHQLLPPDLAYLKDPMIVHGGTPRFIVVDRKQVLYNGFGRRVFANSVVPLVSSAR